MHLFTRIPEHITSRELAHVVRLLGIRLVAQPDGSIIGVPIRPEQHGNHHHEVIRRHRRRINGRTPGPEAA